MCAESEVNPYANIALMRDLSAAAPGFQDGERLAALGDAAASIGRFARAGTLKL